MIEDFTLRPLVWLGPTLKILRSLPEDVQDRIGYALHLAQAGGKHVAAKALQGYGGSGVLEVVADHDGDTYRCVYTIRYVHAVYVVHVFQKKSKRGVATPKADMDIIDARLRLLNERVKGLRT